MKRMFIVIPLLALLVSCNIFIPKECEQLSDMIGDIPALNKNDYNDCELVNQNYMYFAKWQDDSYMEYYTEANEPFTVSFVITKDFAQVNHLYFVNFPIIFS